MKVSTILREAANLHLHLYKDGTLPGFSYIGEEGVVFEYTCDAIQHAVRMNKLAHVGYYFENLMLSFGVPVYSCHAFDEFKRGEERQSVRYAWLMFAADIADEEGLEVC